jgi:hypothetical protein
MLKCINRLICRDRNIVLVGHGLSEDLAVLSSLGFDFQTSIIGIFDTAYISSELEMSPCSLGRLLDELECPTASLHNAGNDANFTLRALILLAIKGYKMQELNTLSAKENIAARIEALQYVSTTPLPGVKRQSKGNLGRKLSQRHGHLRIRRRSERNDDRDELRMRILFSSYGVIEPRLG